MPLQGLKPFVQTIHEHPTRAFFGQLHVHDTDLGRFGFADLAAQGFGWANSNETGLGEYTVTSGLEGAWTPTPTQWDNTYLDTLFAHEWELVESPAGAKQWQPTEVKEGYMVPPVQPGAPETKPTMSTADMAAELDKTEASVRVMLGRALTRLGTELDRSKD